MPDFELRMVDDDFIIRKDGKYRCSFSNEGGKRDFSVDWLEPGIAPGGKIVFSYSGDYGKSPMEIDMDAGVMAIPLSMRLKHIDIEVTGLPDGGRFKLVCL